MFVQDLGVMPYREAWSMQEAAHQQVLDGAEERIFFVEHPPVITFGRRGGMEHHVLASADQLAKVGVEVVQSDRGGDVTFHGPGQLVAYPIIRLIDHHLSVGGYVQKLQDVVIAALAEFNIAAHRDPEAVGVWVGEGRAAAKICALGVRIRRGISLHGIALNVVTNLAYFNLIVPCGLSGRPVTSLQKLLGAAAPGMPQVKDVVKRHLLAALGGVTPTTT